MQDVVLAIVIVVSIWAHVWMFRFMRFKIDEGCVLRFLEDTAVNNQSTINEIAKGIYLSELRVERACAKSKAIQQNEDRVSLLR